MKNKNYMTVNNLIKANSSLCRNIDPVSLDIIRSVEQILSVSFPRSYAAFLCSIGHLDLGSQDIYGTYRDAVIRKTINQREVNTEYKFPGCFVAIHELGNGEISCLDTSQMNEEGECPVVAWYFGRVEKIAEDFGEFLLQKVVWGLKSLEEDGKQVNWLDIDKSKF